MNQSDEKLFAALAREAERRVSEFNAQGLKGATSQAALKSPGEVDDWDLQ